MKREMTNLLSETTEELALNGKSVDEVLWVQIGERGYRNPRKAISFTWEQFAALAKDVNYDSGYGGNEILGTLKIVGCDWWLERGEYDGSEWWEFKTMPTRPESGTPEIADLMERD